MGKHGLNITFGHNLIFSDVNTVYITVRYHRDFNLQWSENTISSLPLSLYCLTIKPRHAGQAHGDTGILWSWENQHGFGLADTEVALRG